MNELTTTEQPNPFALTTFEAVEKMAKYMSEAKVYGFRTPAQAITAMMMAHEESTTLTKLMRRIHFHDDGKISQRADYTQADFEQNSGWIIWHIRDDEMVCGTFGLGEKPDDEARKRGVERFKLMWEKAFETDPAKKSDLISKLADLSREGEETVLRTFDECQRKGITEGSNGTKANWRISPKGMLTARCVTDGVNAVDPSRRAGFSSEDEVADVIHVEKQAMQQIARDPKAGDREAIQQIIDQHLADAAETTSPTEKSRLLGLAAELRCKLEDATSQTQEFFEREKQTAKKISAATSAEITKAIMEVVDATDAIVEPPKKPLADDDQLPGIEPPNPDAWKDYRLQIVKLPAYRGKRLGDLSREEIEVLHIRTGGNIVANTPAGAEARVIQTAHMALKEKK